ncbi:MAG TPA: hypothetical protein VFW76_13705 [Ktedonobacterales bacterium]|nr:hypothetical protein [Ktedonobacterales bacterium]
MRRQCPPDLSCWPRDLIRGDTRSSVRDEIAGISYDGITGHIAFDANGDNAGQKVFSVYGVGTDGKWAFVRIVNVYTFRPAPDLTP